MRGLFALALLVVGLALVGSGRRHLDAGPPAILLEPETPRSIEAAPHPAADLDELKRRVHAIASTRLTAGLSFAIIEHGRTVWTTGLGHADVEAQRAATADTVYRVGSLSKSILALTMASLEDDGLLDLDAPLRDVVHDVEFENAWEATHPIRVTDLLQHSAGFDEMRFNEMFATEDQLAWTTAQVLALNPRSRRARWPPGTRHSYSHPGYTLAGHVVEVVTGRDYESVVRERVLAPLGMRVAAFTPTPAVRAELAVPYSGNGREQMDHWLLHHRPGSHLYASAREMGRIVELLAGRGIVDGRRVLPERVVQRIEQGSTLPYPGLVPSYGLGIYAQQRDGVIWFSHGGWMPGNHSGIRYLPTHGSGYVLMSNEAWDFDVMWEIQSEIMAYLQRDAPLAVPVPRVELEPNELDALAGTYVPRHHEVEFARAFQLRAPMTVTVDGSDLVVRCREDHPHRAVPVGDGRFRRVEQPLPSMMFTRAHDGTPVLFDANDFTYLERIPTPLALAFRASVVFTLVVLGLAVLWPAIWLPAAMRGLRPLGLRAWPCAGAWCVYLFVHTIYETQIPEFAALNPRTAALFALSWAVPICALASLVAVGLAWRRSKSTIVARISATAITLGLCLAALHFAVHGVVGVRTWLW